MRRWIDKLKLTRFVVDGRRKMSQFYAKDRNTKIYEEYWRTNQSLGVLGKKYNMSRQRIWQIVQKADKFRLNGQL